MIATIPAIITKPDSIYLLTSCRHTAIGGQFFLRRLVHNETRMPIYEYLCESCGNKFEKLVRHSDAESAASSPCPSCGKQELKQEYSTFAARAGSSVDAACQTAPMGGCGGGMCGNPGMCGRN